MAMVLEADLLAGRLGEPDIKHHHRKDNTPMKTKLIRSLLVPAVAVAAIAFAAPAAQAAPLTAAPAAQSVLAGDGDQWGDGNSSWNGGNGGNAGLLGELLDSLLGGNNQCGLLSFLLGGCDFQTWP